MEKAFVCMAAIGIAVRVALPAFALPPVAHIGTETVTILMR